MAFSEVHACSLVEARSDAMSVVPRAQNQWVGSEHNRAKGQLLNFVKKQKLTYYGHIKRRTGLANTIMEGRMEGRRPLGRPKARWFDNVKTRIGIIIIITIYFMLTWGPYQLLHQCIYLYVYKYTYRYICWTFVCGHASDKMWIYKIGYF